MRTLKIYFLTGLMIFFGGHILSAQDPVVVTDEWIENLVEEITARSEGEADVSELLEYLYSLRDKPLNLNHATPEELSQTHLLTDFQVQSLQDYIKTSGKLTTMYELQYVPGFSPDLIIRLSPFAKVSLKDRPADDL